MTKKLNLAIVLLFLIFSKSVAQDSCCTVNTITTIGHGKVKLTPDIAKLSITARANDINSASAFFQLNIQVNSILAIFTKLRIPSTNYSTSSILFYPQYDYSKQPIIVKSTETKQTIALTLGNLTNLGNVMSAVGNFNVSIQGLTFEASQTSLTLALSQARKAAFSNAKFKYTQYLQLTGLKNGGLRNIQDQNDESYTRFQSLSFEKQTISSI